MMRLPWPAPPARLRARRRCLDLSRGSENGSVGGLLLFILALLALVSFGLVTAGRAMDSSDEPVCNGTRMSPGDVCIGYGSLKGGTYEEMKDRAPGTRRGNGVAAVVSFSLAGLVLVGGLLAWRSARGDKKVRVAALGGRSMMESVMAVAAREELGSLLDSTRNDSFRKGRGPLHHRFEHGLVVDTDRGPVALPYRDVRIYREHSVSLSRQNDLVTWWRFHRSEGEVWKTLQSNNSRLAQVYEYALTAACDRQREAAVQRLAEGGTLTFGPVEIDCSQMTVERSGRRDSVPWTSDPALYQEGAENVGRSHGTVARKAGPQIRGGQCRRGSELSAVVGARPPGPRRRGCGSSGPQTTSAPSAVTRAKRAVGVVANDALSRCRHAPGEGRIVLRRRAESPGGQPASSALSTHLNRAPLDEE